MSGLILRISRKTSIPVLPGILSKEQKQLKQRLVQIICEKVEIMDNKLYLKADGNFFLSQKIAPAYLNIIKMSLDETNRSVAYQDSVLQSQTDLSVLLKQYKEESKLR